MYIRDSAYSETEIPEALIISFIIEEDKNSFLK
jgi:hypothetical protein